MTIILYLVPVALFLGLLGLTAFIWSVKTGQLEDLEGDGYRILDNSDDRPL